MADGENLRGWFVVMESDAGRHVDVQKRWLEFDLICYVLLSSTSACLYAAYITHTQTHTHTITVIHHTHCTCCTFRTYQSLCLHAGK
jgi:hypothetical protein